MNHIEQIRKDIKTGERKPTIPSPKIFKDKKKEQDKKSCRNKDIDES